MKKDILVKTICISGLIVLLLLVVFFITIYSHWSDINAEALKESLSTTSGIFGGITTLFAAIVAVYLFNDWKEQQKHQNSIQFGLDVYSNFKSFDECFTKLINKLIVLEHMLKEVIRNNDENLKNRFLNESRETSEMNQELYNYYSNFQDAFTNYCIITNQEELLNDIEGTRDSIITVHKALSNIKFERPLESKLQNIIFLTSEPVNNLHTLIYNHYIKQIFRKVKL